MPNTPLSHKPTFPWFLYGLLAWSTILLPGCVLSRRAAHQVVPELSSGTASDALYEDTLNPLREEAHCTTHNTPITPEKLTRDTAWTESFWQGQEDVEGHPPQLAPVHFVDRAAPFFTEDGVCFDVEIHDDALKDMSLSAMTPECILAPGEFEDARVVADTVSYTSLWYKGRAIQAQVTGLYAGVSGELEQTAQTVRKSLRVGELCCPYRHTSAIGIKFSNELYGDGHTPWTLSFTWQILVPSQ